MTELPVLAPEEQRILGSLLEKQTTVPATYPLTANALRSACNQTSNRDPVVDLDQETIERTARSLKERGLLRIVWSDTGRRVLKYHQILDEVLGLGPDERALLTVLLLRGEQAPGELRTRTERLHGFASRDDVEACLRRMAERPQPLVRRAGTATGAAGPPLGPSPGTGPAAGGGRGGARRRPGVRDRRRRGGAGRAGAVVVRRRGRRLRRRSWPASCRTCRSRPGCWTGCSPTPTGGRWSRWAPARATSRRTCPPAAPTPPASTSRPRWWPRPAGGSRARRSRSATCGGWAVRPPARAGRPCWRGTP